MNLPQRMRAAADALEEVSAFYGYHNPNHAPWTARDLRTEAEHIPDNTPNYDSCSGATANTGVDE